jgi:glycosyltransferase involved in cell wall biosynthesis
MRITHIIDSINPSRGGPPAVAARLAAAQASLGHEVSLVSYGAPNQQSALSAFYENIPNCEKVNFRFLAPDWKRVSYLGPDSTISAAVSGTDFLHLHGVWEPLLVKAANYAHQTGIPYAVRPAGMLDPWSLRQKMFKKRLAMMIGCRRMLDNSAFVHALNRDEQSLMEPLSLKCPVHIIPNGVFLEEVTPLPAPGAFRARFPPLGDKPYILFLSRLHYKKGLDYLADAFAIVAKARSDVQLVIAGPDGGGLQPFKRQIAKMQLTDRVVIVGPQYGQDKIAAMVDSACFCLPSRQEGFSMAIIEALACGKPAVISDACHFPEVDEFNAGVVTPLQASSVASALLHVLSDREFAATIGRKGREMILSRYTWPKIAQRTLEVYAAEIARLGGARRDPAQPHRSHADQGVDRFSRGLQVAWNRLRHPLRPQPPGQRRTTKLSKIL